MIIPVNNSETTLQENRWKKRGMAIVPVRYPVDYFPGKLQASVVVYATDGTVAVSHAGIEMVI